MNNEIPLIRMKYRNIGISTMVTAYKDTLKRIEAVAQHVDPKDHYLYVSTEDWKPIKDFYTTYFSDPDYNKPITQLSIVGLTVKEDKDLQPGKYFLVKKSVLTDLVEFQCKIDRINSTIEASKEYLNEGRQNILLIDEEYEPSVIYEFKQGTAPQAPTKDLNSGNE